MRSLHHEIANHVSYRAHRKQLWTQILVPLLLAVVVFLAVIAIVSSQASRSAAQVGRWTAIATVWLILPSLLVELVILAALIGSSYLVARLLGVVPPYSRRAQALLRGVENATKGGAEMMRRPTLAVRALFDFVRARLRRPERTRDT